MIMGLESINLFFQSEEAFEETLKKNSLIEYCKDHQYVYKMNSKYWIDIQMLDLHTASLRIVLSNPSDSLIIALDKLLLFLFKLDKPQLKDMVTKKIYCIYNNEVRKELEETFIKRKNVFKEMYGDYENAIGADEFYEKLK